MVGSQWDEKTSMGSPRQGAPPTPGQRIKGETTRCSIHAAAPHGADRPSAALVEREHIAPDEAHE